MPRSQLVMELGFESDFTCCPGLSSPKPLHSSGSGLTPESFVVSSVTISQMAKPRAREREGCPVRPRIQVSGRPGLCLVTSASLGASLGGVSGPGRGEGDGRQAKDGLSAPACLTSTLHPTTRPLI